MAWLNAVDAILQKLQDDLHELGLKIKHHEDNVKYLKTLQSNLDESVQDMQGIYSTSFAWIFPLLFLLSVKCPTLAKEESKNAYK